MFGSIPLGSDARIRVGLNDPADILVGGLNRWGFASDSPTSTRKYYNGMDPTTLVGDAEDSLEMGGDITVGDDGQRFLFQKYRLKTPIWVELLPDGTNGFKQNVRVSHAEGQGQGVDDATSAGFQFAQIGLPIDVGAGLG